MFQGMKVSPKKGKASKPSPSTTPAREPAMASPPPGFTPQQWAQLNQLAKSSPAIADLIRQYNASLNGSAPVGSDPNGDKYKPIGQLPPGFPMPRGGMSPDSNQQWRRSMPSDTSQLLRQLSYNVGEMPMPGGYVGAVQIPSYGSGVKPVNNPDMSKYGQAPGLGEATFYQQSMYGGMTPVSALRPVGVPSNWNPGGTPGDDYLKKLKGLLDAISGGGKGGINKGSLMSYDADGNFKGGVANPKITAGPDGKPRGTMKITGDADKFWAALNPGQSGGIGGGGNDQIAPPIAPLPPGWDQPGGLWPDGPGQWRGKGTPIKLPPY